MLLLMRATTHLCVLSQRKQRFRFIRLACNKPTTPIPTEASGADRVRSDSEIAARMKPGFYLEWRGAKNGLQMELGFQYLNSFTKSNFIPECVLDVY